jgi:hypothetical protein
MNANLLVMKKGNIPFFSLRKTTRENYRLSLRETYILALGLIGILGIYYVFVLNVNATKGYNVRTLEIARKNYVFEENLLNIKIAEAESLTNLTNSQFITSMEQVENPRYLVLKEPLYTYKK